MKQTLMTFVVMILLVAGAGTAGAQDTTVPCKASACVLAIDWGSGKTSSSFPPDRRYGSGDESESRFRGAMGARAYTLRDGPIEGAITMQVRPTMKSRVMCDTMAGTNPDMTCTAIIGLAVTFMNPDPKGKTPGALRITNRCAAGDVFMLNKAFAQYAADMIWYQLEGQAAKADRPIVNC